MAEKFAPVSSIVPALTPPMVISARISPARSRFTAAWPEGLARARVGATPERPRKKSSACCSEADGGSSWLAASPAPTAAMKAPCRA